jgi:hypothetical protein
MPDCLKPISALMSYGLLGCVAAPPPAGSPATMLIAGRIEATREIGFMIGDVVGQDMAYRVRVEGSGQSLEFRHGTLDVACSIEVGVSYTVTLVRAPFVRARFANDPPENDLLTDYALAACPQPSRR